MAGGRHIIFELLHQCSKRYISVANIWTQLFLMEASIQPENHAQSQSLIFENPFAKIKERNLEILK